MNYPQTQDVITPAEYAEFENYEDDDNGGGESEPHIFPELHEVDPTPPHNSGALENTQNEKSQQRNQEYENLEQETEPYNDEDQTQEPQSEPSQPRQEPAKPVEPITPSPVRPTTPSQDSKPAQDPQPSQNQPPSRPRQPVPAPKPPLPRPEEPRPQPNPNSQPAQPRPAPPAPAPQRPQPPEKNQPRPSSPPQSPSLTPPAQTKPEESKKPQPLPQQEQQKPSQPRSQQPEPEKPKPSARPETPAEKPKDSSATRDPKQNQPPSKTIAEGCANSGTSPCFPVAGDAKIQNNFGANRGGGTRRHAGNDIMADKMTPVVAIDDGVVHVAKENTKDNVGIAGVYVALLHKGGLRSLYMHLNNDTPGTDDGKGQGIAPGIRVGVQVKKGQLLGWVGDSGNAETTAPHLHFELQKATPGASGGNIRYYPMNPYQMLKGAEQFKVK